MENSERPAKDERAEKLAQALRANLRRRKMAPPRKAVGGDAGS